jgi:hypothetical protein
LLHPLEQQGNAFTPQASTDGSVIPLHAAQRGLKGWKYQRPLNFNVFDSDTGMFIGQPLVLGRLFDTRRGLPQWRLNALAQVLPLAFLPLDFGNGVQNRLTSDARRREYCERHDASSAVQGNCHVIDRPDDSLTKVGDCLQRVNARGAEAPIAEFRRQTEA